LDEETIDGCVDDSYELAGARVNHKKDDNSKLRRQKEKLLKQGVATKPYPIALINGVIYSGNLHPVSYVYDAIC